MLELKKLLSEDEAIIRYHLCNECIWRYCIATKGSDDIALALEDTLHRLIDAGLDVYSIMGAYVASNDELKELEEFNEFIYIDLGYILPNLIDLWEELS